jgi:hypothetical protein
MNCMRNPAWACKLQHAMLCAPVDLGAQEVHALLVAVHQHHVAGRTGRHQLQDALGISVRTEGQVPHLRCTGLHAPHLRFSAERDALSGAPCTGMHRMQHGSGCGGRRLRTWQRTGTTLLPSLSSVTAPDMSLPPTVPATCRGRHGVQVKT